MDAVLSELTPLVVFEDPTWEESQEEEEESDLLEEGSLDPDEVEPDAEPWDEGSDDEV